MVFRVFIHYECVQYLYVFAPSNRPSHLLFPNNFCMSTFDCKGKTDKENFSLPRFLSEFFKKFFILDGLKNGISMAFKMVPR